jgi:nicotinic acid phosphoribosyltransferase
MKNISAQGTYTAPTGESITYDFDYPVIDSVQDAVANLGEDKVKSLIQRMLKLDSNNPARESAKIANGHSTRKVMTEEQKSEAKAKRKADSELLAILKSKGLSAQDLLNLSQGTYRD